jgi:hypothetical protein
MNAEAIIAAFYAEVGWQVEVTREGTSSAGRSDDEPMIRRPDFESRFKLLEGRITFETGKPAWLAVRADELQGRSGMPTRVARASNATHNPRTCPGYVRPSQSPGPAISSPGES